MVINEKLEDQITDLFQGALEDDHVVTAIRLKEELHEKPAKIEMYRGVKIEIDPKLPAGTVELRSEPRSADNS